MFNIKNDNNHEDERKIINLINYYFVEGLKNTNLNNALPHTDLSKPGIDIEFLINKFKNFNIPEYPITLDEYRTRLIDGVLPFAVNVSSPHFIGHMASSLPFFIHDLSKLITILNQNVVKVETSKSFTFLEREALAMLHHIFFNKNGSFYEEHSQNANSNLGLIVSGGTIANITALWIARNKSFPPALDFEGVAEEGLKEALNYYKFKDSIVFVSNFAHYSIEKAASLLGIGKKNIKKIKTDSKGILDIKDLRAQINYYRGSGSHIMAIIGIAGSTESGSIDPLEEMADIAREKNIYFHVDAAFGGALIFSDQYKSFIKGIESADSITICGHKQLYLPFGISACLFKEANTSDAISVTADYQANEGSFDFGKNSPEGSRPAFSLFLHAAFNLLGRRGYEYIINNGIEKAQNTANLIRNDNALELIVDPKINIINYRYIPKKLRHKICNQSFTKEDNQYINQINVFIQAEQFKRGKTFVSKTSIPYRDQNYEIVVCRLVLSNPLTTLEDIKEVLRQQLEIGDRLR